MKRKLVESGLPGEEMLLEVDSKFGAVDQDYITPVPVSRNSQISPQEISSKPPPTLDEILGISPGDNPTAIRWSYPQSNGVDLADGGDDGIEEIVWVVQLVESRGGSMPQFLYKKKLVESDVDKNQHRVFLSGGGEREMMAFLREEERAAVDGGGKGLTVVGVDGGGNVYQNLVMTTWGKMRVIKSDWKKVVVANNVKKNDVMEIWGFRVNDKPCLAFKFRGENEEI